MSRNGLISTKIHASIDYLAGVVFPMIPRVFGWSTRSKRIMEAVTGVTVAQTALTDFEGGLKGVIPMQGHLAMDGLLGAGLVGAAMFLDDEPTHVRVGLAAVGLFAIGAALLTDPIPEGSGRSHAQRTSHAVRRRAGDLVGSLAGAR